MSVHWNDKEIGFMVELSPRDIVNSMVIMYDDAELIDIIDELVCNIDPEKFAKFKASLEDD